MSVIDHKLTRVLLIGSSRFNRDTTIHSIPNVEINLRELQACLVDKDLIGIPAAQITVSLNETKSDIEKRLRRLTEETRTREHTLIVYYAGHGILSSHDYKLYLATADSSYEDLEIDAVNIDTFRNYIRRSNAGRKVILLDCCHSGSIIETMGPIVSQIQASLRGFEGTYVMTSASPDEPSMFPRERPNEPTYFTGKFIDIIRYGLPNAGPYSSLRDIYLEIERDFTDRHPPLPRPQQSSFLHADQLLLCRNRYNGNTNDIPAEKAGVSPDARKKTKWRAWPWIAAIVLGIVTGALIYLIYGRETPTNSDLQSNTATTQLAADHPATQKTDTTSDANHRKASTSTQQAAIVPPSTDPEDRQADFVRLFNSSLDDYNAKRYRSAVTKMTKAIRLTGGDAECFRIRGVSYTELEQYEEAVNDLSKAVRLDKKDTSSYVYLGKALKALKQFSKAIDAFSTAIDLDPKDFFPWGSRADCETDLHLYGEAIHDYTEAISRNSSYSWVYCNRANAYYLTEDYLKAITDYSEAIRLDPKVGWYRTYRGDAIRKSGGTTYCSDYQEAAYLGDQDGAAKWEKYCK